MKRKIGIFNDVIGPVMRGPSSSHTAASWRIAKICFDILNEPLKEAVIDFDKDGAWAPNYEEQGTAMGIEGGLLNLDISDDRMKTTEKLANERGVSIRYEINSFPTEHANTVRLKLEGVSGSKLEVTGISLGGGSFEITKIGNANVKISGDHYDLLVFTSNEESKVILEKLSSILPENIIANLSENLINCKFSSPISELLLDKVTNAVNTSKIIVIEPIMPIVAGNEIEMPFDTVASLLEYAENENKTAGELGLLYEKCQSNLSDDELLKKMSDLVDIIQNSIKIGLAGTEYHDRILPQQSHLIKKKAATGGILNNSIVNNIIENVSAIMESKSALELVVANPTAGSCGTVGGVLKAVADSQGSSKEEIIMAYYAAGLVGAYFAQGPGFSAEEHGCQVECGAASGMAAAGIVQLFGGTAKQAIGAASMAIQNMVGLVCDPVADRVEVPCLGKNISAAMNALSSATMSTAGFNAVIPLNEVIETVSRVSEQMPSCNKCTGRGGLAITETAQKIKAELIKKRV